MEQERDYIDKIIEQSFEDIQMTGRFGEEYNRKLLEKLHGRNEESSRAIGVTKARTAAISLITAGFLMGFMYTSQVQYNMANFEYKIKANFALIKHNINLDKLFMGE